MSNDEWVAAPPGRKALASAALAATVDAWLSGERISLAQPNATGVLQVGGSSGSWDEVLRATVDAAAKMARYSELARSAETVGKERLVRRADTAAEAIRELAELVVVELQVVVDRSAVTEMAAQFVDEVEQEDDGIWHAADAIGSLFQARLICAEEGIEMPCAELERSGVAILAPLVAQAACVRWP